VRQVQCACARRHRRRGVYMASKCMFKREKCQPRGNARTRGMVGEARSVERRLCRKCGRQGMRQAEGRRGERAVMRTGVQRAPVCVRSSREQKAVYRKMTSAAACPLQTSNQQHVQP